MEFIPNLAYEQPPTQTKVHNASKRPNFYIYTKGGEGGGDCAHCDKPLEQGAKTLVINNGRCILFIYSCRCLSSVTLALMIPPTTVSFINSGQSRQLPDQSSLAKQNVPKSRSEQLLNCSCLTRSRRTKGIESPGPAV